MGAHRSAKNRIVSGAADPPKWRARIGFALSMVFLSLRSTIAWAQPPIVPLTFCGTISKSVVYEVDALLTSPAGDCLIIRAPNVTVNLNRQIITGQGSGAGVHVLASGRTPLSKAMTRLSADFRSEFK